MLFLGKEAQHDRASSMTKTEIEWERVRTADVGSGFGTVSKESALSSTPTLYEMLKQKADEESAIEEEERQRGSLPKSIDEDGTKQGSISTRNYQSNSIINAFGLFVTIRGSVFR